MCIRDRSEELLYAHMIEHLLLGDIAALLIVLGLTGPLLAPILRIGVFDRLRALSHPAIAFPLWTIDLYVWHLPVLYQAALRHAGIHALEHAMFLGLGVNMWTVSYTHLRAHETVLDIVCRLLLEK